MNHLQLFQHASVLCLRRLSSRSQLPYGVVRVVARVTMKNGAAHISTSSTGNNGDNSPDKNNKPCLTTMKTPKENSSTKVTSKTYEPVYSFHTPRSCSRFSTPNPILGPLSKFGYDFPLPGCVGIDREGIIKIIEPKNTLSDAINEEDIDLAQTEIEEEPMIEESFDTESFSEENMENKHMPVKYSCLPPNFSPDDMMVNYESTLGHNKINVMLDTCAIYPIDGEFIAPDLGDGLASFIFEDFEKHEKRRPGRVIVNIRGELFSITYPRELTRMFRRAIMAPSSPNKSDDACTATAKDVKEVIDVLPAATEKKNKKK